MSASIPTAKFQLGRLQSSSNAQLHLTQEDLFTAFQRHQAGDWGDVCEEDRQSNELALIEGTRLWSVYHNPKGTKFWVITEADRSRTTVLLPEDY